MSKRYTCIVAMWTGFLLFFASPLAAQIDVAWDVSFDFGTDVHEVLRPAIDDEGNVYVVARIGNLGTDDMRIAALKINSDGAVVWDTLRDEGVPEWPVGIGCDALGNAYIVGWTVWGDSASDILTLKYDPEAAELEWYQVYDHGGYPFSEDEPDGMVVDDEGNVYISATVMPGDYGHRRLMMLKYDAAGNLGYNQLFSNAGCSSHPTFPCQVYTIIGIAIDRYSNAYTIVEAVGPAPDYWEDVYVIRVSPEGAMTSAEYSCGDSDYLWDFAIDREGNSYFGGSALNWNQREEVYCLFALNSDLSLRWQKGPDDESLYSYLHTDSQGNLLADKRIGGSGYKLAYDNGEVLCEIPVSTVGRYDLDPFDNVYNNDGGFGLDCYDPQCGQRWHDDFTTDKLVVDDWGNIYTYDAYYGNARVRKWVQAKMLTIKDGSDQEQPIANTDFLLIKVTSDPDPFTEDTLGEFTTNADGKLVLEPIGGGMFYFENNDLEVHTLEIDDTLKVGKHVMSVDAVKHTDVLGTMYSVFLDNAKFHPDGSMNYDELTIGAQDIIMDHTEYGYNLLVSVEWDADLAYLIGLETNLQFMCGALYDATDGQARLDTVKIFDSKVHWDRADLKIYANNVKRACAKVNAINLPVSHFHMPRKAYGNGWNEDKYSRKSFREYREYGFVRLDLGEDGDWFVKNHEFGHYAFDLLDEYRTRDENYSGWRCEANVNHGYMDHANHPTRTATEMSNDHTYRHEACRTTWHWEDRDTSCWGHFEKLFEKADCGEDGIFVPVITADERYERQELPAGDSIYQGPGMDVQEFVWDKVVFPIMQLPPAAGKAMVLVWDENDRPLPKAKVWLVKGYGEDQWEMYQGKTCKSGEGCIEGGIYVVGKEADDKIRAEGDYHVTELITLANPTLSQAQWYFGEITSDASDSFSVALRPVEGDYPLICGADLDASTATYWLDISQLFSEDPTVRLVPDAGGQHPYTFYLDGSGYSANVTDSLGNAGMFTVNAVDDSSFTFFFTTNYTAAEAGDSVIGGLNGPGGQSEVTFDTLNSSIQRASLLSSPYPVIPTGLDSSAMQGGETHCLSVYPQATLLGDNVLTISYAESDVVGSDSVNYESSLQIYRWNETQWQLVGGYVDTSFDFVSTLITEPGVYGAFTTPTALLGDANSDGIIDLGDAVYILNYLFKNGPEPDPLWAGDCNCDEIVDLGDVVLLLNYLFKGGPAPSC